LETVLAYIIPVLASFLVLISFLLFLFSGLMKKVLYFFFDPQMVNIVLVFRMFAGFAVIAGAPASAAPTLMIFVGATIIFFAFATPLTTPENLDKMAQWWLSLPIITLKFWGLLWMVIWFLLGYIALPSDSFIAITMSSYMDDYLF
jgi:hypothetical protein